MSDNGWGVACSLADSTGTNRSEICEIALRILAIALEEGEEFSLLQQDALAHDKRNSIVAS
jgi:hypothetical protein